MRTASHEVIANHAQNIARPVPETVPHQEPEPELPAHKPPEPEIPSQPVPPEMP